MVGGAALARQGDPLRQHQTGASYLGVSNETERAETWVGGDMHGDFRTNRRMRPLQGVTTSLDMNRRHDFMPLPIKSTLCMLGAISVTTGRVMERLKQSI